MTSSRRYDNDSLLLWLMLAVGNEHQARTGHNFGVRGDRNFLCDVCMYLYKVNEELGTHHYEELAASDPGPVLQGAP